MHAVAPENRTTTRLIQPARNIQGSLRLPGDKSISHRYALLGGLAEGTTRFTNFSTGADCASTLACMEASAPRSSATAAISKSPASPAASLPRPAPRLRQLRLDHAHDLRPARAAAWQLHPHRRRLALAPPHGAHPQAARSDGRAHSRSPTATRRSPSTAARSTPSTTPRRFPARRSRAAFLFAGLQTAGHHHRPRSRPHPRSQRAGPPRLRRNRSTARQIPSPSPAPQSLHAIDAAVPGDLSSAAFFLCAAALFPGSSLVLDSLGLNPTRATLLDVLTALGAHIAVLNLEEKHAELVGTVQISAPRPRASARPKSAARSPRSSSTSCPSSPPSRPSPAAAFASAARASCASRSPTASRWSRRISAPWAPKSKSSTMASTSPAARRSTAPPSIRRRSSHRHGLHRRRPPRRRRNPHPGRRVRRHQLPRVLRPPRPRRRALIGRPNPGSSSAAQNRSIGSNQPRPRFSKP